MKYILTLLCLVSFVAYGQEPAYTPMRLSYQFRTIKVDSLFLIPSFNDTTAANNSTMKNVAGALIRTGNDFWMRNSTLNAWLQNVNVGEGSSTSNKFVDSVWRVAGKDSIFWRKGGTTNKIKDSTGGRVVDTIYRTAGKDSIFFKIAGTTYKIKDSSGKPDSPDRINGTATISVTSDIDNNDFTIQNSNNLSLYANRIFFISGSDSVRISSNTKVDIGLAYRRLTVQGNKLEFKDFNNTFLRIDTLGNFEAGDLTKDSLTFSLLRSGNEIIMKSKATPIWREQNNGTNTYLKVGRGVNSISLASATYSALVPGVYVISTGGGNDFKLPDADDWPGQSVTVINTAAGGGGIATNAGSIFDRGTGNTISSIAANEMIIFYSDGSDWYGAIQ